MQEDHGTAPLGPGLSSSGSSPSVSPPDGASIPSAVLRSPEDIWKEACVGREGSCSSDLQAAARDAILTAQVEALTFAASLQPTIRLPDNYQWSESNFRKFEFGTERFADAIYAAASAMSARSAETEGLSPKDASAIGNAETPTP